MTIEDRVRRVLAEAVADEPPQRGAPLEAALRRRRRRPVLAGAVPVVLVLAAVAGVAAIRARQRPLPSLDPTRGWTTYTDTAHNLRLRYPPGWVLREKQPGWIRIAPPEQAAGVLKEQPPFAVGVRAPAAGYYLGQTGVNPTRGRLAGGQAYVVVEGIADPGPPPRGTATTRDPADLARYQTYAIDWGRACTGGGARCGTRVVMAGVMAANRALWDRYRAVGETIVGTIAPVTAPGPVVRGPQPARLPPRPVAAVPPRRLVLRRPRPALCPRGRLQVPRRPALPPAPHAAAGGREAARPAAAGRAATPRPPPSRATCPRTPTPAPPTTPSSGSAR